METVSIWDFLSFPLLFKGEPLNEQRDCAAFKLNLIVVMRHMVRISDRQSSLKGRLINNPSLSAVNIP